MTARSHALTIFLLLLAAPACEMEEDYELEDQYLKGGDVGGLMQSVEVLSCFDSGECFTCTGTLMGPRSVLTAAHCVTEKDANLTSANIIIGSNVGTGRQESIDVNMSQVHLAEGYTHFKLLEFKVYDVAVLGLQSPADLPIDVSPWVKIGSTRPADDSYLWVNGRNKDGVSSYGVVTHAVAKISSASPSSGNYPYLLPVSFFDSITESGDSGGALFLESGQEANDGMGGQTGPTVYGVTSRGSGFARLDPIAPWIRAVSESIENTFVPTTCDNDVAQGQVVCAFQGDDTAYRCMNPGGVSAPDVANSQWQSIPCTGTTSCRELDSGNSWCVETSTSNCSAHNSDVNACNAAPANCAYYFCTDQCLPQGTQNVCP